MRDAYVPTNRSAVAQAQRPRSVLTGITPTHRYSQPAPPSEAVALGWLTLRIALASDIEAGRAVAFYLARLAMVRPASADADRFLRGLLAAAHEGEVRS